MATKFDEEQRMVLERDVDDVAKKTKRNLVQRVNQISYGKKLRNHLPSKKIFQRLNWISYSKKRSSPTWKN
ncbi:hypothetical protein LWI28_013558 [Acer negundo]|uniref:Uncharacterized protein n=1 Tax=Acer negundo TaxID=4023 RepID=A0AAD5IEP2_ACENE|nr:hypothetical protein LWI28_013558 [Acer negundo]